MASPLCGAARRFDSDGSRPVLELHDKSRSPGQPRAHLAPLKDRSVRRHQRRAASALAPLRARLTHGRPAKPKVKDNPAPVSTLRVLAPLLGLPGLALWGVRAKT